MLARSWPGESRDVAAVLEPLRHQRHCRGEPHVLQAHDHRELDQQSLSDMLQANQPANQLIVDGWRHLSHPFRHAARPAAPADRTERCRKAGTSPILSGEMPCVCIIQQLAPPR
jgi:hypothetical protein